jgi:hypothetical protein
MTIVQWLVGLGILLEVLFFAVLWPPWRSKIPQVAWLLAALAGVLASYDALILLGTLHVHYSLLFALFVVVGKDVLLGIRIKIAMDVRGHRPRKVLPMNPLFDVIPARARKYVYAAVALFMIGWGAYQAADGNWKVAVGALITTVVAGLAHANVEVPSSESKYPQDSGKE